MARVLRRAPAYHVPSPPETPLTSDRLVEAFSVSSAVWAVWEASTKHNTNGAERRMRRRGQKAAKAALGAWVLAWIGLAAMIGFDWMSSSQLFAGTRIGGVVVGSRSVSEAEALLTDRLVKPLQTTPLTIRAHTTLRASAWALGVRMDVRRAVQAAYDEQRSTSLAQRLWQRAFGDGRSHPLRGQIDEARVRAFVNGAATQIDREPKDASVVVRGETLEVVPHQVGRRLDVSKAQLRLVSALRAGHSNIRLPVEITQPALRTEQFKKVILVRTATNRLDLYVDGKVSTSYPVATGTPGYPTPHGQFHITAKRRHPTWGNPWAPWSMNMPAFIGPGPNNPLGTRALNLSVSGIRIHGTPDADSIGGPASHGCIRMYIHDAEELFELVDVGTPVVIVGT